MTHSRSRWIVTAVLTAAAAGTFVLLLWPRPLLVDTAAVRRGPIAETVADQGTARVRQSFIVSAPVSGRLERLPLEAGDPVAAGKTTVACIRPAAPAFLDPRSRLQAEAAVEAARAALAAAIAQRDRAAAEATRTGDHLRRVADLARQHVVSSQESDNAKAEADVAANALRAAEADVSTRRANLASAQLALANPRGGAEAVPVTAPASGVVTRLLQQSERTVVAGTPLVEIGDTSGLEAAIEFVSQDAVRIRPGQKAVVYNWGGEDEIAAQVRRVEPFGFTKVSALGVEEQRTIVYLQFTAACESVNALAPGYRVWGRVYLREVADATLVPIGALVRDSGRWAVYRVEGGRAKLRPVTVGTMTDQAAEARDGVAAGDVLVIFPSDQVSDGVRVRPR